MGSRTLLRFALAAVVAGGSVACSTLEVFVPTSTAMHDASPAALVTPADRALVVFLRPSYFGAAYALRVVDERGQFVADVPGHTYAAVTVAPGEHVFTTAGREMDVVMRRENILFAHLGPGRVYFVLVDVDLGGPLLEAITPGSENWASVREWLADTRALQPNDDALGRPVLGGDQIVLDARKRAEDLAPSALAERTLKVEDGVARAW